MWAMRFVLFRVKVMDAQSLQMVQEFAIKDVIEIDFSPKGTFISTWVRQSKCEQRRYNRPKRSTFSCGQAIMDQWTETSLLQTSVISRNFFLDSRGIWI